MEYESNKCIHPSKRGSYPMEERDEPCDPSKDLKSPHVELHPAVPVLSSFKVTNFLLLKCLKTGKSKSKKYKIRTIKLFLS